MRKATICVLALGIVWVTSGIVYAEANVPPAESSQAPHDPRAKSPMDELAAPDAVAQFTHSLKSDWTLFVEDRLHPIRWSTGLPERWLSNLPGHTGAFAGTARPGEFYVFQIGVFAAKAPVGNLAVKFGNLASSTGTIPSKDMRCLSLGGTNFMGQPFTKHVGVPLGKLQALWIGVDVPKTGAGNYSGSVTVRDTSAGIRHVIALRLAVAGAVLTDHGDQDSWRLSRLRWLDSTIGLDDNVVTRPFTPIVRRGDVLKILGRDLVLGADGLPRQVRSYFNADNTAVEKRPTCELLASPFHFVIETDAGEIKFPSAKMSFIRELKGAVNWHAVSQGHDLELTVDGLLEYDGFVNCHCRFRAIAPLKVKDIRLEAEVAPDATKYFMGLGHQGGRSPEQVNWRWNPEYNQDGFWIGAVNGGFKLELYGANWRAPLVNCYYHYRPLEIPESWGGADGRTGGIRLAKSAAGEVRATAYSGPRTLAAGDKLNYNFKLCLTPFKTIDTDSHWRLRYIQPNKGMTDQIFYHCDKVKAMGANVINIHQAEDPNPVINYPYFDQSLPLLTKAVASGHANGMKAKVYYTTRETSCNAPELYAFWSMNGEIVFASPGKDGVRAHPLTNANGPNPWLVDHLGKTGYIPAWHDVLNGRYHGRLDLAVITTPDSRLENFYLQGLSFLLHKTDIDGVYVDDTSLSRKAFQRAQRIFQAAGKPLMIDMHSWNEENPAAGSTPSAYLYMQDFPYINRIWFGEGFNYNTAPDYWLVEMSGIPYGLMSEMLQGGGNKWRGMLFGMTQRLGWSGDPRPEWKFWDKFGMKGTKMIGWWDPACPVKTDQTNVLATVYKKAGRALIALASWAPKKTDVKLNVNWKNLGLDAKKVKLHALAIKGYQSEATFGVDDRIPVEPGRGWLLIAKETSRP